MAGKQEPKSDREVQNLVKRKLELTAKIRELKAESAKLSIELSKNHGNNPVAIAVVSCW